MAAPPFWQEEGDATSPAGYSADGCRDCRATQVPMKKMREYPLCGATGSRYNDLMAWGGLLQPASSRNCRCCQDLHDRLVFVTTIVTTKAATRKEPDAKSYDTITCGRNSVVECQLPKLDVVGSNPIARSRLTTNRFPGCTPGCTNRPGPPSVSRGFSLRARRTVGRSSGLVLMSISVAATSSSSHAATIGIDPRAFEPIPQVSSLVPQRPELERVPMPGLDLRERPEPMGRSRSRNAPGRRRQANSARSSTPPSRRPSRR